MITITLYTSRYLRHGAAQPHGLRDLLGLVRHEPRSGYEIKSIVDNTTRFFWAASYGQIYSSES